MIQIAVLAVSIGLIFLGVGFTAGGIPLTKTTALKGTQGKIAGVVCIVAGVLFIPLFLLAFFGYGRLFGS
ncbi:MAG: hypothetical protein WD872_10365 [Pirellulaceae bacterium]